jgi:putative Mg2+ transporter-C (MgtC) family protein
MSVPMHATIVMLSQILFSLVLGWVIGYERYFRGRASGTQVYCLVSMASCAVTVFAGYPTLWYAGTSQVTSADPTHIVGNILTGIGFLGPASSCKAAPPCAGCRRRLRYGRRRRSG